jgi:hypothetical protein
MANVLTAVLTIPPLDLNPAVGVCNPASTLPGTALGNTNNIRVISHYVRAALVVPAGSFQTEDQVPRHLSPKQV